MAKKVKSEVVGSEEEAPIAPLPDPVDTPVSPQPKEEKKEEKPLKKTINKRNIISQVYNGTYWIVIDEQRTTYTLPVAEYEALK